VEGWFLGRVIASDGLVEIFWGLLEFKEFQVVAGSGELAVCKYGVKSSDVCVEFGFCTGDWQWECIWSGGIVEGNVRCKVG